MLEAKLPLIRFCKSSALPIITFSTPLFIASKALANLDKIYKSKSSAKKHELEQKFNECKLIRDEKNPDEFFAELDKIRLQLQIDYNLTTYDDEKVKSHILYYIKPRMSLKET